MIVLHHDEIVGNDTARETRDPDCGCSGGGKFWDAHNVTAMANWIHDNFNVGFWADQNNFNFRIEGNWIEGNRLYGIFYETSYNAVIRNNVLRRNKHPGWTTTPGER